MLDCQKPKKKRQPAIDYPEGKNGRQVCNLDTAAGRREYLSRIQQMVTRQRALCSICGTWMNPAHVSYEHQDGRGMGGGHRDDRIEIDGEPYNSAVHGLCNVKKGSIRLDKFKEKAA